MIGIRDRAIAFSFDMRCGELLVEFEAEQQQRQMAVMNVSAMSGALGGAPGGADEGRKPIVLNA